MNAIAAVALLLALAACSEPGFEPGGRVSAVADAAARHERGRAIYNFRCYFCHGYSGDAKTLAATYLAPTPRDFTSMDRSRVNRDALVAALREGRAGTAMKSFSNILSNDEIELAVDFVLTEFVQNKRQNTRYHTAENGWPDHERFRAAFSFATGEVALDTPFDQLDQTAAAGKRLFLNACITCHDRARVADAGPAWDTRPVSYPPDGHDCTSCHDRSRYPDRGPPSERKPVSYHARSAAHEPAARAAGPDTGVYSRHDNPRHIADLSRREKDGELLYLQNCSFCHAADGTAKNWIGRFLEPHPRDLTSTIAMRGMTRDSLAARIREGLPGTSMPAWGQVLRPREIEAIVAYISRAFYRIDGSELLHAAAPTRPPDQR